MRRVVHYQVMMKGKKKNQKIKSQKIIKKEKLKIQVQ